MPVFVQGFILYVGIMNMDKIQKAAVQFLNLVNTTSYIFHLANRTVRVVSLNFMLRDFHHIAGFQYLIDINIPRNKKNTIPNEKVVNRTNLEKILNR